MRGLREGLSLEDWELDLEAVVDRLGFSHFILVHGGSSAYVSVSYAVKHPDRVDALVLENMPLERRSTVPPALDELAQEKWELFLEATARLSFPWEDHSTATDMVRETWSPADWSLKARVWQDWSVEEWLRQLNVPTLVLASNLGTIGVVGGEEIRHTAALIPGARLIGLGESEGGIYMLKGGAMRLEAGQAAGVDVTRGPQLVEDFLRDVDPQSGQVEESSVAPSAHVLSAREIEVLRLLAAGRSNQQIADELVISLNTVNRHVSNIYTKTGAANRAGAVGYAHRHGLAG